MKGSLKAKSIKVLDIDSLDLQFQFGWLFMSTLLAVFILVGVARGTVFYEIDKVHMEYCTTSVDLLFGHYDEVRRADTIDWCMMESDPKLMLDFSIWDFKDAYPEKHKFLLDERLRN